MKKFFASLAVALALIFPALSVLPAYAACTTDSQGQVLSGFSDCTDKSNGQHDIGQLIASIISILSWVVGIAAVIVIILSALKFITSGGSSEKTTEARRTLMYALVGLLVAALAQLIIHFTVDLANNGACPSNPGVAANSSQC